MAQRVTLEQATRLTGRTGKTLRSWLAEDPPVLSVTLGHFRGGVRTKGGKIVKGQTRLLDVDELEALNAARVGTWHPEHLPPPNVDDLAAEIASLKARLTALETGGRIALPRRTWLAPGNTLDTEQTPASDSPESHPSANFLYNDPPQARQQRRYTRPLRAGDRPLNALAANPIQPGWIAVSRWCKNHGIDDRSMKRAVTVGQIRMPLAEHTDKNEAWGFFSPNNNKWYPVTDAYRDDQIAECAQKAQTMWPEDFHPCYDPYCPCHTIEE